MKTLRKNKIIENGKMILSTLKQEVVQISTSRLIKNIERIRSV